MEQKPTGVPAIRQFDELFLIFDVLFCILYILPMTLKPVAFVNLYSSINLAYYLIILHT